MTGRTKPCPPHVRAGRQRKAIQFVESAQLVLEFADDDAEVADVYVTLCVHAGIAAADVICCARLGRHAIGDSHHQAKALLAKVDPGLSTALGTLLALKTPAGYDAKAMTVHDIKRAGRAASKLIEAAATA